MNPLSGRFVPLLVAPSPMLRFCGWVLAIAIVVNLAALIAFLTVGRFIGSQSPIRDGIMTVIGICVIAASISLAVIGVKLLIDPLSADGHPELMFLRWLGPLLGVAGIALVVVLLITQADAAASPLAQATGNSAR